MSILRMGHQRPSEDAVPSSPSRAASDPFVLYAVLLVVAAVMPIVLIRSLSLSYDELFSLDFAAKGLGYMLGPGRLSETNPPFYFLLLKAWIEMFGNGEAAVRVPSLIAHFATVPVVFAIARRLDCGRAAWYAAILYAFGAAAFYFALLARGYALWTLLLALALLELVCALRALEAPPAERRVLKPAIGFAAASAVAFYTHDATFIVVAAADLTFLAGWLWRRGRKWRDLAMWVGPQIVTLAVAAPQFVVMAHQLHSPHISWIPPLSMPVAFGAAFELFGGPRYPLEPLRAGAALVAFVLFLWGTVTALWRRSPVAIMPVITITGFALLCLVSVWRPLLLLRTLIWASVPVAIVIARAIDGIRARLPRLGVFTIVAALTAANAGLYQTLSLREPWRDIVVALAANKKPHDIVVLMPVTPVAPLLYYGPGADKWNICHWDPRMSGPSQLDRLLPPRPQVQLTDLFRYINQGRTIWLLSLMPQEIILQHRIDDLLLRGTPPSFSMRVGFMMLTRLSPPASPRSP
jgi:mannosyltransferase